MENTRKNIQIGSLVALVIGLGVAGFEANRVYNSPAKGEMTEEQAREETYHTAAGISATIIALGAALVLYATSTIGSSKLTSYRHDTPSSPAPQH